MPSRAISTLASSSRATRSTGLQLLVRVTGVMVEENERLHVRGARDVTPSYQVLWPHRAAEHFVLRRDVSRVVDQVVRALAEANERAVGRGDAVLVVGRVGRCAGPRAPSGRTASRWDA
jgi:hypothetical protein